MREIKFRAWDKTLERMIEDVKILGDESLIYLQYTEFHDKNKTEIYDGHILKTHTIEGKNMELEVSWESRGWACLDDGQVTGSLYDLLNCRSDIEIVNNVYEKLR